MALRQAEAERSPESASAKRRQILAGARQVFGELGFERASVDLVAARAGVSKATIYKHYEDKKALFVACVTHDVEQMRAGLCACTGEPACDVEDTLQLIGEKMMRIFLSPGVVALYRHIVAEAARLPELGQTIFDRGLGVVHQTVASYLEGWNRSGALRIDDVHTAAVQFVALCQGDLAPRVRLAILKGPAEKQVRQTVKDAVRTFVRAYRP